jgi:hypothetical protein
VFFGTTVRVLLTLPCSEVTVCPIEIPRGVGNRCTVIQRQSPILSLAARHYTGTRLTRSLCILGISLKSSASVPKGTKLSQDRVDGNLQGGGGAVVLRTASLGYRRHYIGHNWHRNGTV